MVVFIVDDEGNIKCNTYDNIANLEAWEREMNEIHSDMWYTDYQEALDFASACITIDLKNLRTPEDACVTVRGIQHSMAVRSDEWWSTEVKVSDNLVRVLL